MSSDSDKEFEAMVFSQLEIIDSFLSKKDVDVAERPFAAADFFIKYCVHKVNDQPPDNYIIQPWFKYIIRPILKWYEDKYGTSTIHPKEKSARGIASYNGVLYELRIPLTIFRPTGETGELIFPKEVLHFEDEASFVLYPPIFEPNHTDALGFYESVRSAVNLTRSIRNNIHTALFNLQLCTDLSNGIEPCVQKAVDDILSGDNSRFLSSYWEIHLALEKAIKILIAQSGEQNRTTHDLQTLWEVLNKVKPGLLPFDKLNHFPPAKTVIEYRYGNGPVVKRLEVYSNYMNALQILDYLTTHFNRKVVFDNTVFLIGKLPWHLS
jgi:hypothetical protein